MPRERGNRWGEALRLLAGAALAWALACDGGGPGLGACGTAVPRGVEGTVCAGRVCPLGSCSTCGGVRRCEADPAAACEPDACDGPEDCPAGTVCVTSPYASYDGPTRCAPAEPIPELLLLCHCREDCPRGFDCVAAGESLRVCDLPGRTT